MKKRYIIIAVILLSLSTAALSAQENVQQSGNEGDLISQGIGIIKEIKFNTLKIGSIEYPVSSNVTCYSETNSSIPLSSLKVEDGVKYKLDEKGKIIYLKKVLH